MENIFNVEIPAISTTQTIIDIVEAHNATLFCPTQNLPNAVGQTSIFIAENFHAFYPFLNCLRKTVDHETKSVLSDFCFVANNSAEYESTWALIRALTPFGFFSSFKSCAAQKCFQGRIADFPKYTRFICGDFAEYAANVIVQTSIDQLSIDNTQVLRNVHITSANGSMHEIDLLVCRNDGRLLAIEVKSGFKCCPEQIIHAIAPIADSTDKLLFSLLSSDEEAEAIRFFSGIPVVNNISAFSSFITSWLSASASKAFSMAA